MPKRLTKRLLLIGWDAADWRVINPLLDDGKMPALEAMVDQGVIGNLATLQPVLSPMLWTSIATGMRPFQHGILGFTEPREDGKGITPVTNLSRRVKAIWNILQQQGIKSNVVGWWPSHPAEPIDGVMVSNHYPEAVGPADEPWPMRPGTVHPQRLNETLAELRLHPTELEADHLLPFVPRAAEIDQTRDTRLLSVAKTLAECTSIQSAATWLMENEDWEFMAVYYDAIDHFSHGFMKYHPPRRSHISENDFDLYHRVVEMGYVYHSLMLGRLLDLAGEDTTVILVSDHGFHCDHLRPSTIPHEPAGPAFEHRNLGVIAMKGPGIAKDERISGANLLDVVPTILTLFGLPTGADMEGQPLLDAFESRPEVAIIPSWEEVAGDAGQHPPDRRLSPDESEEALEQLVALGYIDAPDQGHEVTIRRTQRELDYNLALSYMDANRYLDAVPILEKLYRDEPGEYRFGFRLSFCYRVLERIPEMRDLVESLIAQRQRSAERSRKRLRDYAEEAERRQMERDGADEKPAEEPRAALLFTPEERHEIAQLQASAQLKTFPLDYLMGTICVAEGKGEEALRHLSKAESAEPHRPGLHLQIGEAYLALQRWSEAEKNFAKALEIDPESAHAHLGLCRSLLPQKRTHDAAEHAKAAVGISYHFPAAHFYLGVARHRLGRLQTAIQSLETAVSLNPNFIEAHRRLAYIYGRRLLRHDKVAEHREIIREIRRVQRGRKKLAGSLQKIQDDVDRRFEADAMRAAPIEDLEAKRRETEEKGLITVVSGLPRSGTSMIMQMLAAGGATVLTDELREADEDNPLGYLEYEKVKRLHRDDTWMPEAVGKVVKVVAPLLPHLPRSYRYRVVLVERDMREVLASQRALLARENKKGADLSDEQLARQFGIQLKRIKVWLKDQPHIESLVVQHGRILADPAACAAEINGFLGGELAEESMATAVDSRLHRQHAEGAAAPYRERTRRSTRGRGADRISHE